MSPAYRIELLGPTHDRMAFACGNDALDRYVQQQASQDVRRGLAVVYVLIDTATNVIAGYYTLSATSLDLAELTPAVVKRLPRYPSLPATLLGRLARDSRFRGRGAGEALMLDALKRSLEAARHVASFAVVVDAIDDGARGFYERFDFSRSPHQEYRLFLPMATIDKLFTP